MKLKLTKRKGFNFFRSYYDVYNELSDADKVAFIDALMDRQFLGVKPNELTGMAKFAYISQTHSIDEQVKGYEDKTNTKLTPCVPPPAPPTVGVKKIISTPTLQVEVQGEVEVEEKEKGKVEEKEKQTLSKKAEGEIAFNFWWDIYDKKTDRRKCLKKFLTLSIEEMRECYDHSKLYVKAQPDKQYRRNPITYLNNENWKEDEFTKPRSKQSNGVNAEAVRNNLSRIEERWSKMRGNS